MTETLMSNQSLALAIAAFVFFIAIFLASKQWIGFSVTFVLLLFSLASGLIVANLDIVRGYSKGTDDSHAHDIDVKLAHFQEQVLKSYDGLKADMEIQKHKLQMLSDDVEGLKKEISKEAK